MATAGPSLPGKADAELWNVCVCFISGKMAAVEVVSARLDV